MISYEIALKLKEAGFKSSHQMDMDTGGWCVFCPYEKENYEKGFEDMCFPTLSELIEACGDKLKLLINCGNHWQTQGIEKEHECRGSTPSEAVANLWLSLNTK